MTMRVWGGIALFLLGTTWVWLTPAFASRGVSASGFLWDVARVGSFLTIAGFCLATWGLFTRAGWWETAALASAAVGLAVLVPYWVAAARSGESAPWWNVVVHVAGVAGVFALLLVPQLEHWVDKQVMGG